MNTFITKGRRRLRLLWRIRPWVWLAGFWRSFISGAIMAMTCSAPSPPDMLIDNLMIYWATETIGSSTRVYYDHRHFRAPFKATDHVRVPTEICMWPRIW
jgi:hypothetical protein